MTQLLVSKIRVFSIVLHFLIFLFFFCASKTVMLAVTLRFLLIYPCYLPMKFLCGPSQYDTFVISQTGHLQGDQKGNLIWNHHPYRHSLPFTFTSGKILSDCDFFICKINGMTVSLAEKSRSGLGLFPAYPSMSMSTSIAPRSVFFWGKITRRKTQWAKQKHRRPNW